MLQWIPLFNSYFSKLPVLTRLFNVRRLATDGDNIQFNIY